MTTDKPKRRVVVTGMGAICPLSETVDGLWSKLIQGESGIGYITSIPDEDLMCRIGGECSDFTPEKYMEKKFLFFQLRASHTIIGG